MDIKESSLRSRQKVEQRIEWKRMLLEKKKQIKENKFGRVKGSEHTLRKRRARHFIKINNVLRHVENLHYKVECTYKLMNFNKRIGKEKKRKK